MRRSLASITLVTVLLISLVGVTAVPMAAQSGGIATEVSNGNPDEVVEDTTVTFSTGDAVDIRVKAESASDADVTIEHNTTTNTVSVAVDANGDGTVDITGEIQSGDDTRLDIDTETDVPASLRLVFRPKAV